ncbi:hypothetical protein CAEBREN_10309 [Caenorhabditis brenneri]|uniref:Uncharacterized protein n=1 Tax=Caenorhabditis brenneri TaxID=135651 RepID=G0N0V9_CAEBE|nr:hypothetical protein CAEBREN_10309 [Caenorhabditis brenneri]
MMNIALLLMLLLAMMGVVCVHGQRVFDMMDEPKSFPSNGPSAFYERKSYLQPFYAAPSQVFWRRSD